MVRRRNVDPNSTRSEQVKEVQQIRESERKRQNAEKEAQREKQKDTP